MDFSPFSSPSLILMYKRFFDGCFVLMILTMWGMLMGISIFLFITLKEAQYFSTTTHKELGDVLL